MTSIEIREKLLKVYCIIDSRNEIEIKNSTNESTQWFIYSLS